MKNLKEESKAKEYKVVELSEEDLAKVVGGAVAPNGQEISCYTTESIALPVTYSSCNSCSFKYLCKNLNNYASGSNVGDGPNYNNNDYYNNSKNNQFGFNKN